MKKTFLGQQPGQNKIIMIYQNIFPFANTFAKREKVRLGQLPIGTQMVSFGDFLMWLGRVIEYPQLEYM